MTKNETKVLKMNLLGGMDTYLREHCVDENWFDLWLEGGVPDGATEDDLEYIACDNELFTDCCLIFARIVSRSKMSDDLTVENDYYEQN